MIQLVKSPLIAGFIALSACHPALAHENSITDYNKTVINQVPYKVEVCRDVTTSGDKTADTLKGAIIGGIIGNNVTKNVDNGGTVGALLGGMLGHSNSNASGGTKRVCNIETRYKEESLTLYSHSKITFEWMGKTYTVQFQK